MKNLAGKNYKIEERKSSQFGRVGVTDVQSDIDKFWAGKPSAYYDTLNRKDTYETTRDRYLHDQLARPIINTIVNATFQRPPDFQGNEKLVKRANQIVRDSEIDWAVWGKDLEIYGDIFIRAFFGVDAKLASIPPGSIDINFMENNILRVSSYEQFKEESRSKKISIKEMTHGGINKPTDVAYGSSTLRPVLWWLDVLDNLWERNWIRAAQYYGAPVAAITGVPGEQQAAVQTQLEGKGQRPGRHWIFPAEVKVETLDFTKNYPIEILVDRVYQYILAAVGIPQHLIYESDSSRGVAMFSADGFEMMIKLRRQTWALGLLRAINFLLKNSDGSKGDLRIRWSPVFSRDLKALAQFIDVAVANKIFSLKTARERMGADHSVEVDNFKKEPDETPVIPTQVVSTPKTTPRQ